MVKGKPICDNFWGKEDAMVVCRQLGYLSGKFTSGSLFGPVSPDFGRTEVQCTGDEEYIWRCPHLKEVDCGSSDAAGVICSNEVIELVGGSGPHEGNIMIYDRPVCDYFSTTATAEVVCRQLGYLGGGNLTRGSHFGQVSDDFAMAEVKCYGYEKYIWRCPHETELVSVSAVLCDGDHGLGVMCFGERESGSGSGSGSGSVEVMVMVLSATTGLPPANATVGFYLGAWYLSATTDSYGTAHFTLSPDMIDLVNSGAPATIEVSAAGYISLSEERSIRPDLDFQAINIFPSPELSDGEHRVVLSWVTKTDLDIYVLQIDKEFGVIVCKTWYDDTDGCTGVKFDNGASAYGPETITWNDAATDNYEYMIYVHDNGERGTVAGTRARITLYGETEVKMQVVDGDSGEPWWVIGIFEPSVGTTSWSAIDQLATGDPDNRL